MEPSVSSPTKAPPDCSKLPDDELLLLMALQEDDHVAAHAALSVFWHRHSAYLYNVLRKFESEIFGNDEIEDIVQSTFVKVYEKAAQYEKGGVKAWIGRVAERLVLDYLRREDVKNRIVTDIELISTEVLPPKIPQQTIEAYEKALATLTKREYEVIRVTGEYLIAGALHQRLPNEVCENLAAQWNTTSDNIRQIRHRAIKKLRSAMESIQGVKNVK